jgi:hypothetical protein
MKAKHWFSVALDMGDAVRAPWRQVTRENGLLIVDVAMKAKHWFSVAFDMGDAVRHQGDK